MRNNPAVFAHRGAKAVAPENTLPAFEQALAMNVDGVELDVHCSMDGELVVIHNFDVDETTDGNGPVASFSAAQLAALDASVHFDGWSDRTGVPTLVQVLDLIGARCRINVEIKSMDIQGGGAQVEPLLALIRERDLYDQVLISSFNPVSLIKTRWLDDRVALGVLHGSDQPLFLRHAWSTEIIRPQALHPHHTAVDAAYMAWARQRDLAVNTWTVNDLAEARRLAELGVDAIISDVPDQLMATLRP